jgi:hypothetical protein
MFLDFFFTEVLPKSAGVAPDDSAPGDAGCVEHEKHHRTRELGLS